MVQIYNEITIYFYKAIFASGARLPPDPPAGGIAPPDPAKGVPPDPDYFRHEMRVEI